MNNPIFLANPELLKGISLLHLGSHQLSSRTMHEISSMQLYVLSCIYVHPLRRIGEIAKISGMSNASLARLIADLVKKEFVQVHCDQDDKRIKRLSLSTKGLQSYTHYQEESIRLIFSAYRQAGSVAVEGFTRVLKAISNSHMKQR